PSGTLLRILGQRVDAYLNVEVELVEGKKKGWVLWEDLDLRAQDKESVEKSTQGKRNRRDSTQSGAFLRPKERLVIPKDEAALLTRRSLFSYGVHGGM